MLIVVVIFDIVDAIFVLRLSDDIVVVSIVAIFIIVVLFVVVVVGIVVIAVVSIVNLVIIAVVVVVFVTVLFFDGFSRLPCARLPGGVVAVVAVVVVKDWVRERCPDCR